MANYIKLKSDKGFEITYSIRMKVFLLIQTNFKPLNFPDLVEKKFLASQSIKELDAVGMYDDGTGYMIYLLHKGYNLEQLKTDIEKIFQNYFIDKQI